MLDEGMLIYIHFINYEEFEKDITVNYDIETNDNEGILKVRDYATIIYKDKNGKIVKIENILINRTYVDNKLRHEINNTKITDLTNISASEHTIHECYIDLNNNAVLKEIVNNNFNVSIKYYETDDYSAPPFNDLDVETRLRKNIFNEINEQLYNEFINSGNNNSLTL